MTTQVARWRAGIFILGSSAVGSVMRGASGDWFAYGWMDDYEDTPLGPHTTEDEAKRAVEEWVESFTDAA
jgi:hypothetical protein